MSILRPRKCHVVGDWSRGCCPRPAGGVLEFGSTTASPESHRHAKAEWSIRELRVQRWASLSPDYAACSNGKRTVPVQHWASTQTTNANPVVGTSGTEATVVSSGP